MVAGKLSMVDMTSAMMYNQQAVVVLVCATSSVLVVVLGPSPEYS